MWTQDSLNFHYYVIPIATMESVSDYERGIQYTEPSTPIKEFSIRSLIKRVDEYWRRECSVLLEMSYG